MPPSVASRMGRVRITHVVHLLVASGYRSAVENRTPAMERADDARRTTRSRLPGSYWSRDRVAECVYPSYSVLLRGDITERGRTWSIRNRPKPSVTVDTLSRVRDAFTLTEGFPADLPGRGLGEFVDELDLSRVLVGSQPLFDTRLERLLQFGRSVARPP